MNVQIQTDKLTALITELESKIPHCEEKDLSISTTSVGWHIDHSIMVVFKILEALKNSNPLDYQWKFNLSRMFVFTINKIPRGKGKAPKSVIPIRLRDAENLKSDFPILKAKINEMNRLHPNNYFLHPYFGDLNLKSTIRMLKIHTEHHIGIIDDIIRKQKKSRLKFNNYSIKK